MASQEFLASFAVDIDEGGVTRLQSVLEENRTLAEEAAAAFSAATAAIREYQDAASGNTGGTGESNRDAANASKKLISWQDIGLESDPSAREGYSELMTAARELIREPMEQAREYMQQAIDAEEAGQDGSEYIRMVDEVLRSPLEQVRELVDSFDFGDESGTGRDGTDSADIASESGLDLDTSAAEESLEAFREKAAEPIRVNLDASDSLGEGGEQSGKLNMDLTEAKANLEAFRADAAKPVSLLANASGMVSAARSAYSSIKSLFSTPITIKAVVEKEGGEEDGGTGGLLKMSAGGRFTKPTDVQVAEDGDAEYIIPVKKENRAVPLLRQLLSELSPSARASLSLGDGASSLISGGLAAGQPAGAQITQNNSNISAPVTIQVRSSGANPEQVGQKLYDTAERYLLRTLEGALACDRC